LLVDGEATYGAMLDAIAGAESYVLVQFYIVMDGTVAQRMHDALIEKAQAGVRVYFLYDEIGCWSLPAAYLASLRNASIEVFGFKTTRGHRNRFQINFRNHRKLLVVDGRIGFIGGLNLADDYLKYRDTHLKVDDRFANRVEAMLKADLEHCESVDRAHFDDKPLLFGLPPGLLVWPHPCGEAGGDSGLYYHNPAFLAGL
jgi:cardiolipin synthase